MSIRKPRRPVGNDSLTFDVLYEKVLRTYYLLYPVMIPYVQLNSETDVARNAQAHSADNGSFRLDVC